MGVVNLAGLPADGIGWYSGFVASAAVVYAGVDFTSGNDPVFGVIWLAWAGLWLEFFVLMALGRASLTRPTGWSLLLLGQVTTTVPAFFILTGHYRPTGALATVAALVYAALFAAAFGLGRRDASAVAADGVPVEQREHVAA